jgi:peptidoglycan/xylan/chitin deacetylase (PgdA/CDA1 family)
MVRKILRSLASSLIVALRQQQAPRILYYHRVDEDDHRSCVRPAAFRQQMRYLAEHDYPVLSLTELYHALETRASLPQRSIVLTFDDGFADNFHNAYPVLRTHAFPATIFLTVGFIGSATLPVFSDQSLLFPPLTWGHVSEMNHHGIAFGSHTLSHPMLPMLSEAEARKEIADSRRVLTEQLGHPVEFFCYPRGAFSPTVQKLVQQAGYTGACSTIPGAIHFDSNRFALPRTYIGKDDSLEDFRKKLCGAYDVLHLGVQLWRRLRLGNSGLTSGETQLMTSTPFLNTHQKASR